MVHLAFASFLQINSQKLRAQRLRLLCNRRPAHSRLLKSPVSYVVHMRPCSLLRTPLGGELPLYGFITTITHHTSNHNRESSVVMTLHGMMDIEKKGTST